MFSKQRLWIGISFILLLSIVLAACSPMSLPAASRGDSTPAGNQEPVIESPTSAPPAESPTDTPDAVQSPEAFRDPQLFRDLLLQALASRDAGQIQALMGEGPFLYGGWRGEIMDVPPADAVQDLLRDQLGAESRLAVVEGVDLPALMGGKDPLSIPRPEAGVTDTLLVSGWGADGRDEALLFLALSPDGKLSWRGTLVFQGGITSQATGGVQEYSNQDFGFSLYYPKGFEVQNDFYHTIVFLAPAGTQGHRERAFLRVELAGDLTAEWYANRVQEENANMGTAITSSVMSIDGQPAYILGRLPGQDLNRQVFIVYKGILYHLTFMPDDPQAGEAYWQEAYQQMEALYGVIINTLLFLPDRKEVPPVTDLNNMIYQLERALEARSEDDVLRTLGDEFFIGYWMPEGVTYARYGRNEAAREMIANYMSPVPDLVFQEDVDWPSVMGSPEPFTAFFPNEVITPVLVQGWGSQGSDEAVIFIARRSDGSLYWRGVLVTQGTFAQ